MVDSVGNQAIINYTQVGPALVQKNWNTCVL